MCFVDFRKAFDHVWRTGLFYKLLNLNIDSNIIKIIRNMYSKTKQYLNFKHAVSEMFKTFKGVRQGCILSPKLFDLFINDIPTIFDSGCDPVIIDTEILSCIMYADDLVLMSKTKRGLQNCINKLYKYSCKWKLEVNLNKTKVIVFQNNTKKDSSQFFFGNSEIEKCQHYKYLGTIITHTGNFKLNEVNLKKKGLRAAYIIAQNLNQVKPSLYLDIFHKIVEPILTYNGEITMAYIPKKWDLAKFKEKLWEQGRELNKVLLSSIRQALGVHKKICNIALLAETGNYPIIFNIYINIFKYWIRLNSSPSNLLKAATKMNSLANKKGKHSWMRIVVYLVKLSGINPEEITLKPEKHPNMIKIFKSKLLEEFHNWWTSKAVPTGHSKLDFYYDLKKTFCFQKYLDNVPKELRKYVTKLRLSGHYLPIEVLRYKKIERKKRYCNICNSLQTGDESHYLVILYKLKNKTIENKFSFKHKK